MRENMKHLMRQMKELQCKNKEYIETIKEMRHKNEDLEEDREKMRKKMEELEKRFERKEKGTDNKTEKKEEINDMRIEERKVEQKPQFRPVIYDIPKIEAFDNSSNRSWEKFITDFEFVMSYRYPNSEFKHMWTSELGKALKGELGGVFRSYGGNDTDYEIMKENLGAWVKQVRETQLFDNRKFMTARMGKEESPAQFAARLGTLFREEYPGLGDESQMLMQRLFETLPPQIAMQVKQQFANTKTWWGRDMKYQEIINYLISQTHNMQPTSMGPAAGPYQPPQPQVPLYSDVAKANLIGFQNPFQNPPIMNRNLVQCRACNGTGIYDKQKPFRATSRPVEVSGNNDGRNYNATCRYCQKKGHMVNECRRRLGLCYRCGQAGHFSSGCNSGPPSGPNRRGPRPQQQPCYVCGVIGHVARNCDKRYKGPNNNDTTQEN